MKRTCLALFAVGFLVLSSTRSHADNSQVTGPEILTYSQLMRLPMENRRLYVEGLRQILIDLAKNPDGRISDSDPAARSKLKVWIDWLDREMPDANAQESRPAQSRRPVSREVTVNNAGPEMMAARTIEEYVNAAAAEGNRYRCVSKMQTRGAPDAPDLVIVNGENQTKYCSAAVEAQIQNDFQRVAILAGQARASASAVSPRAQAKVPTERVSIELTKPPAAAAPASSSVAPATIETVVTELAGKSPQQSVVIGEAIPKPVISMTPLETVEAAEEKQKPASTAPAVTTDKCPVKGLDVCKGTKLDRAKVFQGYLGCIFAGMVSKLDAQNRKCTPVTEFDLGTEKLKCGRGQTMCNPMLFGTITGVSKMTPICVGRGHHVTEQCSKISNAAGAAKFLSENHSGLQERWNELKDGLAKICGAGTLQAKFHCVECNVIRTRAHELKLKLVPNPCDDAPVDSPSAPNFPSDNMNPRTRR